MLLPRKFKMVKFMIVRGIVGMGSMGSAKSINFQRRVLEPIVYLRKDNRNSIF